MAEILDQGIIMKVLDYAYDKALNGLPGMDTAEELANDYLEGNLSLEENATKLVRWQIAKAGTSGFITGLGGLITIPFAVPANIASVLYVQVRMIAAIAVMGKYDVRSDQVKSLVYMCLCGSAIAGLVKDIGVRVGSKLTAATINKISGATLRKINQAVGFRLLTKFGQTGVVNFGKLIPILGGFIGGIFDSVTTKLVGKAAINVFLIQQKTNQ